MKYIIYINETGRRLGEIIQKEAPDFTLMSQNDFMAMASQDTEAIIFIGALGICVRMIAPMVNDKYSDPAVVCVDSAGHNVISVLSGHVGGANRLCEDVAHITGALSLIHI